MPCSLVENGSNATGTTNRILNDLKKLPKRIVVFNPEQQDVGHVIVNMLSF